MNSPQNSEAVPPNGAEIEKIKEAILKLAGQHNKDDDLSDAEMTEIDAETLIWEYCDAQGYQVEGFPHEKRKIIDEEEDEDEYFCSDRWRMYADHLVLTHDDVAELMLCYANSFFPDYDFTKADFIEHTRDTLKTYDIGF